MTIRPASPEDAEVLLAIYAHYVRTSPVSFELDPPSLDEFRARIAKAQSRWEWLVADEAGELVGYAYGTQHRERPAYRFTVETSAYVKDGCGGRGIGSALYWELLDRLTLRGYCTAVAGITLPNDASVALHRTVGFQTVGVFPRIGWKFGRWHDSMWLARPLSEGPPDEDGSRYPAKP